MEATELIPDLFRNEFSKMVAVISRLFGLQAIEIAEDIVSETFLQATETWVQKGIPANPAAWLYTVARQKTLYHFRRNKIFKEKILPELESGREPTSEIIGDPDFSADNIRASELQMMFAICHPAIASEAQIALALRILCGFGIDEIAEAFLSNKETINKRLFRAKEKLRTEKVKMEMPGEDETNNRLENVLRIIYLLFNEGYYSKTQNQILRKDLCLEAMRLAIMLTESKRTNRPKTNALIALMCFHASRFNARQTSEDLFILYKEQNEQLWDHALINLGIHFLNLSAQGDEISSYHLEARIAFWHCMKEDTTEKWAEILQLYDHLLMVNYTPSIALNRIFALFKVKDAETALADAEKLKLENNHFYFILIAELFKNADNEQAKFHLEKAYALAKTKTEKQMIQAKIDDLTFCSMDA